MASQESTQYATLYTTKSKLGPEFRDGKARRILAEALLTSELAIGETLKFAKLPANATLIELRFSADVGAGAGVLDLGWAAGAEGLEAADPNGIISGATEVSTALQEMDKTINASLVGYNKKFSEAVDIEVVATTATTASTGQNYRCEIYYILE